MKKINVILLFSLMLLLLSACGKKDASEFVDVKFEGMDSNGQVYSEVDEEKIAKDLYDVSGLADPNLKKDEVYDAINSLGDIEVKFDKEENLSNGDKVKMTITVPEDINKLKSSEKTITVKGLEEPKKLTEKAFRQSFDMEFEGADGFGTATLSNNVDGGEIDISVDDITIENNGKLKNGEQAYVHIKESAAKRILNSGYKYEKDNKFKYDVKGLIKTVAEAKEIKNYDSIIRRIDEDIAKLKNNDDLLKEKTQIKEIGTYYRPYNSEDAEDGAMFYKATENATLYKVIEVKVYDDNGKDAGKLDRENIQAIGYTNITFDDSEKAKLTDMQEYQKEFEDGDSIDTIKETLKEYGYKTIE